MVFVPAMEALPVDEELELLELEFELVLELDPLLHAPNVSSATKAVNANVTPR